MPPLVIGGAIAAAGAIGGAALGSHAAGKAAQTQSDAAIQAAQIQAEQANKSLDFEKQIWQQTQANQAPFLKAGQGAVTTLASMMPSLSKPFTGVTMQNDPGYQFRLQEGQKALERSAAARGDLLTGGTAKAEQRYGQDYASNEYQNAFNRFQTQNSAIFNRYASLAGLGQQTAGQLGSEGQSTAGNVANINMTTSQNIGNALQNAAAARASGYVGGANAWGGALGNLSQLAYLPYLSQLMDQQNSSVATGGNS